VGLVSEAILWKRGSYSNPKRIIASWTANGLLHQGTNLLPILFFWDVYYSFAMESGMDQSYVDDYLKYYTEPGWLAFILILTLVCAFVGALIGTKLLDKHFRKAGVL
ncbi:MAG: MptD family putative ECF transporter S component, partial [Eggerthellaceae bacterium]|nr:MptD family putative ECF transporter S component [Eggerthellaceae bacterium]